MIIVKADKTNIPSIMVIVNEAKQHLKNEGTNQWQDGYPNEESFLNDIKLDRLYVVKEEDKVIGVFVVVDYEPTYDKIYEGEWIVDVPYIAVHRIAVKNEYKGKGVAKFIFDSLKKDHNDIRVDTHRHNKNMNKCLLNNDFKYCGIIYLERTESDIERLAYEFHKTN